MRRFLPSALLLFVACAPTATVDHGHGCSIPDAALLITPGKYEVAAGTADTLHVYSSTHPGAFTRLPEPCRPVWTLSQGAPATLDARSGILQVSTEAIDGSAFTVHASIAGQEVDAIVRVVDPDLSPLVGTWHQTGQVLCGGSAVESSPDDPIRELRSRRNGRFSVTWAPFESYTDYSGTYLHDPETERLEMEVDMSNFLPRGLDLDGRVEIDTGGALHLHDLWLGSRTPDAPRACRSIFRKRGS